MRFMFEGPKTHSSKNCHKRGFCLAKDLHQLRQTSIQTWSNKKHEK